MERQKSLRDFRQGKTPMLLATDVAARGLDIQGITHVVHFDFSKDLNQYVHRSGRTGSFGAVELLSPCYRKGRKGIKKICARTRH